MTWKQKAIFCYFKDFYFSFLDCFNILLMRDGWVGRSKMEVDGGSGWVQNFIFLFLVLIRGMRRCGELKVFLSNLKGGKIFHELLKNIGNVLQKWVVGLWLGRERMEFVTRGWYMGKIYKLIIWSWNKQSEILLVMIREFCLRWFNWYWRRLKLRELVTKEWVHVFPGLVLGRVVV